MTTEATTTAQIDDPAEDAAFAAGFEDNTPAPAADKQAAAGDTTTEETAKDDGSQPASETAATTTADSTSTDQQPQPKADVDPFAGLPPAVRDLLAEIPQLRARTETAELRAKEAVGRMSSMQSKLDKLTQPPAAADQAPAKQVLPKVQALRDQGLPEIADAIEELAQANAQATPAPEKTPEPAAAAPSAAANEATPDELALNLARPTWAEDLVATDFQLWLSRQPKDYQQRIAATDKAADIMDALKKFDVSKTASPPPSNTTTRNSRIAAAVLPNGDGRRAAPRGRAVEDDEDAAFEAGFKTG